MADMWCARFLLPTARVIDSSSILVRAVCRRRWPAGGWGEGAARGPRRSARPAHFPRTRTPETGTCKERALCSPLAGGGVRAQLLCESSELTILVWGIAAPSPPWCSAEWRSPWAPPWTRRQPRRSSRQDAAYAPRTRISIARSLSGRPRRRQSSTAAACVQRLPARGASATASKTPAGPAPPARCSTTAARRGQILSFGCPGLAWNGVDPASGRTPQSNSRVSSGSLGGHTCGSTPSTGAHHCQETQRIQRTPRAPGASSTIQQNQTAAALAVPGRAIATSPTANTRGRRVSERAAARWTCP